MSLIWHNICELQRDLPARTRDFLSAAGFLATMKESPKLGRRHSVKIFFAVLALSLLACLMGCAGVSGNHFNTVQPPPSGPVKMEVLFPPSFPGQQYYADMQKYVINNASAPVTGANFAVQW